MIVASRGYLVTFVCYRMVGACMPRSYRQVEGRSYYLDEQWATRRSLVVMLASLLQSQNWPFHTRRDGMLLNSMRCRQSAYHRQGRSLETTPCCEPLQIYLTGVEWSRRLRWKKWQVSRSGQGDADFVGLERKMDQYK